MLLLHITAVDSLWNGALEMTPDSVQYVAAAQNLLQGQDYLRYEGTPYVAWPPLYATVIAAVYGLTRFITSDLIHIMRFFHIVIYMILIYTSGRLFFRYIKSPVIALLGTLAVTTSPTLYVSHLLWSEEIFTLLIIVFLLVIGKFLETPSLRLLIPSAILAALIVLQRYAGIAVIGAGGVMLLLLLYQKPLLQRVRYAFIFGVIAIAPISFWMLRNYLLTGKPAGTRSPSVRPLTENIGDTANLLQDWFIPNDPALLAVLTIGFLLVIFGTAILQHYRLRQESGVLAKMEQILPLPVIILATIYIVFLNITLTTFNQGAISIQYLMPAYIPALVIVCSLADRVVALPWGKRWGKWVVVIWIVGYVMPSSFSQVNYLTRLCCPVAWRNSELVDWLEMNADHLPKPIYANTPLSNYRGIRVRDLPRQLEQLTVSVPAWDYEPPDREGFYVVWYNHMQHDTCPRCYMQRYTLAEFNALFDLDTVIELNDGTVYLVTAKEG